MKVNKLIFGIALAIGVIPVSSYANTKLNAQAAIDFKIADYQYRVVRDSKIDEVNDSIRNAGGMSRLVKDADNGDAKSNFLLYEMYSYGIVYKQDDVKAHQYLLEAVESRYAPAMVEYGYFLLGYADTNKTAKALGDPNDSMTLKEKQQLAMSMFLDSAYSGNPKAQYIVGTSYILGKHIDKDHDLGMFWLSQSQANGYKEAELTRINVDKALNTHINFEQVATDAKLGKVDAMVELAKSYLAGYDVEFNEEKAYRLLATASKLGNAGAKELLKIHF